jgi:hypothetical protein
VEALGRSLMVVLLFLSWDGCAFPRKNADFVYEILFIIFKKK